MTASNNSFIYKIISICGQAIIWLVEKFLSAFISQPDAVHHPADYPFCQLLEEKALVIQTELQQLLQTNPNIPALNELSEEQKRIVQGNGWKTFIMLLYGKPVHPNIARVPETYRIIQQIPGLTTAFFSIMEGGTHILPHRGPYKGLLRCHLALQLPNPPTTAWIAIDGKRYHWQQNKCLIFDDTITHEAKNESTERRIVLFLDFKRNFPFPVNLLNSAIIHLISNSPFIQNTLKMVETKSGTRH